MSLSLDIKWESWGFVWFFFIYRIKPQLSNLISKFLNSDYLCLMKIK